MEGMQHVAVAQDESHDLRSVSAKQVHAELLGGLLNATRYLGANARAACGHARHRRPTDACNSRYVLECVLFHHVLAPPHDRSQTRMPKTLQRQLKPTWREGTFIRRIAAANRNVKKFFTPVSTSHDY